MPHDLFPPTEMKRHSQRIPKSVLMYTTPDEYRLDLLTKALLTRRKRRALQKLKGDSAQSMIDLLHWVRRRYIAAPHVSLTLFQLKALLPPTSLTPRVRDHCRIILIKLCVTHLIFPRCFGLDDVERHGSIPVAGGGFSDIFGAAFKQQTACLKIARSSAGSDHLKLNKALIKEGILWGQLQHPNITPIYGIYSVDSLAPRMSLVLPWMENGDLTSFLINNPRTPRMPLTCDIVRGLSYLHDENIIHGDLKGANILVNDSCEAFLADFGLSSVLSDTASVTAEVRNIGPGCSYRWLAPEFLNKPGRRSKAGDVWALGGVLYEIFTRRLPFHECRENGQVIHKLMGGERPTRPQRDASDLDNIPDDMWALMIHQIWDLNPTGRPACDHILRSLKY
ncbi:hypothetical protein NP233_g8569 [Leucocoprinus birnbaumii]|uniref:Protein kinase domain-containing protein n=1 Tax=Leucocoprinus birnbaumii TaxID=56174 RepID=A0AAD5VM42_9AGAR|nr:hypothetical protein NP233_g8569 [Leucocoprinus birnbaumii]